MDQVNKDTFSENILNDFTSKQLDLFLFESQEPLTSKGDQTKGPFSYQKRDHEIFDMKSLRENINISNFDGDIQVAFDMKTLKKYINKFEVPKGCLEIDLDYDDWCHIIDSNEELYVGYMSCNRKILAQPSENNKLVNPVDEVTKELPFLIKDCVDGLPEININKEYFDKINGTHIPVIIPARIFSHISDIKIICGICQPWFKCLICDQNEGFFHPRDMIEDECIKANVFPCNKITSNKNCDCEISCYRSMICEDCICDCLEMGYEIGFDIDIQYIRDEKEYLDMIDKEVFGLY